MGSQRGVTLLEMLIALSIAALLMGMALPLLHRPSSAIDMDQVVREVTAGLREARASAIAGNRVVAFTLDLDRGVFGHDRMQSFGQQRRDAADDLRIVAFTAGHPRRDGEDAVIRFFPDGGSTGGQIEFRNAQRRSRVDIDWLTGRISVSRDNDAS